MLSFIPPRVNARTLCKPRLVMNRSVCAGEMDSYGQPANRHAYACQCPPGALTRASCA
jgi:hypothetical protein